MSFINNPLGSGGTSYQGLGNLTAGIEALQRTEIQRRIGEIEQEKANKRADALRNEEFALKMASTDVINDRRVAIAEQAAKDAESFMQANADLVKKAQSEGRGLTLSEKMKIMTDQKKILQNNAQAANFTDALEKAQSIHISTLKTLKDPVSKEQYNKQWADLYQRMKDPVLSKDLSPSDIIAAVEPPPPPFSVLLQEKAKQLLPFVDSSVKSIGGGRTEVDRDKLMTAIKANVSIEDPLYTQGVSENRLQTPDQMYSRIAEILAPSIKTDVVGWAPKDKPESEVLSGFEGLYQSSVREGERSPAYVFDKNKYKMKTSFTTPEGKTTNADMTPLAIKENGMVEGEFTVDEKVTSDPMGVGEANFLKIQTGGRLLPADKDGNVSVVYMQPKQYVSEVKMTPDMIEKIKRSDPKAAKYIEDTVDPYPKRTGAKTSAANKTTRFTVDGKIYDIPTDKIAKFKQTYPNAK